MLIAINTTVRRRRRRLGLALTALVLSAAVVTGHGAMAGGHMGATTDGDVLDDGTGAVLTMCLAIVETAALALGAVVLARALGLRRGLSRPIAWPAGPQLRPVAAVLAPRPRPPDLSLLQVFRW